MTLAANSLVERCVIFADSTTSRGNWYQGTIICCNAALLKKRNALWTHTEGNGKVTTAFERMRPVGGSNNHRFIAVPFGCKLIMQIPRESSLCTDDSHGSRAMEGILVGADHSTYSIHVYLFETTKDAA